MKPGDLVRIAIPFPIVFDTINEVPSSIVEPNDVAVLLKYEPAGFQMPGWHVLYKGQVGILSTRWIKSIESDRCGYLTDEEIEMALTPQELIEVVPDAIALAEVLNASLKKDADGTVRISKSEAKKIRELAAKLAIRLAAEALD